MVVYNVKYSDYFELVAILNEVDFIDIKTKVTSASLHNSLTERLYKSVNRT